MNALPRLLAGWILLIGCFTGCQSLTTIEQPALQSQETITVQIRAEGREPVNKQIALKPNMRLQEVVDQSKARFRNKIVHIVRISPSTGARHKLEAVFGSNRRISLETDYAVQPGDRVVIAEDTRSSLERVMLEMIGRS